MFRLVCSIAVAILVSPAYAEAPPNKATDYKAEIRRLLEQVDESTAVPIPSELRGWIAQHQPEAGDVLLSILATPNDPFYRRTLRAFVSTWDLAISDQIDRYIQQVVSLKSNHRAKFPTRSEALISFEAQVRGGRIGWPCSSRDKEFDFRARTNRYLDGKPYDKLREKLYDDRYPFGKIGAYKVGELVEGKHTVRAFMEYEFTHRGQKR